MVRGFDIVDMDSVNIRLAEVIGYKKVYARNEIIVTEDQAYEGKCIFLGREHGALGKALRRNNVEGIMIFDNELIRQTLEECRDNEKILFVDISNLTVQEQKLRLRNIHRARFLIRSALRSRTKIALVSLAKDEAGMLSAMQMLAFAKFLGINEKDADSIFYNKG